MSEWAQDRREACSRGGLRGTSEGHEQGCMAGKLHRRRGADDRAEELTSRTSSDAAGRNWRTWAPALLFAAGMTLPFLLVHVDDVDAATYLVIARHLAA